MSETPPSAAMGQAPASSKQGTAARTAIATAMVVAAGVAAFSMLTQGFAVVTSEAARRLSVARSPVEVPSPHATDQRGNSTSVFAERWPGHRSRATIVDFVYTRCASVCQVLGDGDDLLQAAILARGLEQSVRLVTVSFDPSHDTPESMRRYAERHHADPRVWSLATPDRAEDLPPLLAAFGIVVVPAPLGQFQHNAAFHVLDAQGKLARIVDADDPLGALDAALATAAAP